MKKYSAAILVFILLAILSGWFLFRKNITNPVSINTIEAKPLAYEWNGTAMLLTDHVLGVSLIFPEGWSILESSPQQFSLLDAEATANPSDSDLLRGMKFSGTQLTGYADATLEQIEKGIEDKTDRVESQKTVAIDGVPVLVTKVKNVAIYYSAVLRVHDKVITFGVGIGPNSTGRDYETTFMTIIQSLKVI
jgi:hypothetical protein